MDSTAEYNIELIIVRRCSSCGVWGDIVSTIIHSSAYIFVALRCECGCFRIWTSRGWFVLSVSVNRKWWWWRMFKTFEMFLIMNTSGTNTCQVKWIIRKMNEKCICLSSYSSSTSIYPYSFLYANEINVEMNFYTHNSLFPRMILFFIPAICLLLVPSPPVITVRIWTTSFWVIGKLCY